MSWPAYHRLCRNCGGVTRSQACYGSGAKLRNIDKCDFCSAKLTDDDNYDTYKLPEAHGGKSENE